MSSTANMMRRMPIRYLGRYTHRVAISNHRLISFDGGDVTFRWRDYAGGNKTRVMTVSADEFMRRFLLHVLRKGFVRIRHFGVLANHCRSASIDLCRNLLEMAPLVRYRTARHRIRPGYARGVRRHSLSF
jgi:hypothetical protein